MLETLNRETAAATVFDAEQPSTRVHGVGPRQRCAPALHRPAAPQPALRPGAGACALPVGPPSARRPGVDRPEQPPATRVRLTRRGRLALLVSAVALLFSAFSAGRVLSRAADAGPAAPTTHTLVVAPGDTAWSIARQAMPTLDGRDAVDRLLAMNHSNGNIRVGQTLTVPGS